MTMMMRSVFATGLLIGLAACSVPASPGPGEAELNASTPGWTGRTFVVGSSSTVAGDADATFLQQKWGIGRDR
jgi:hypothetical protein